MLSETAGGARKGALEAPSAIGGSVGGTWKRVEAPCREPRLDRRPGGIRAALGMEVKEGDRGGRCSRRWQAEEHVSK